MYLPYPNEEAKADVLHVIQRTVAYLSMLAAEVAQGDWSDPEELENIYHSVTSGLEAMECVDIAKQGDTSAAWVVFS